MKATQEKASAQKLAAGLHEKACEILRLSALISELGLAHAFVYMSGHVRRFTAQALPADTNYNSGHRSTYLNKVDVSLEFEDLYPDNPAKIYHRRLARMTEYVDWLKQVLAEGKVLKTEEHAA
ncbi:hypothetical protein KUV59_03180 [Marinobacter daepoensis]|uniref:hypothetical protein n=1 Tax=Marinobacter daepoensis TaxID=262077 RepID=UPI001C9774AB|nr:hypothetical protein [Marinobacter daepoensis]MBY6032157.1 hypothetical protein [Marinobacter daepoensis]